MSTDNKPAEAPKIEYSLEDGKVIRTDHEGPLHVANYKGGIIELIPDQAKFRPAIVRFVNEQVAAEGSMLSPVKSIILAGDKTDPVKDIPPPPKKTMRDGDKTPAYVEWLKKYKPNEYKARYGIIGEGKVMKEKIVTDEEGKPKKVAVAVDALLAERKIHLTEKPEANQNSDYADEDPKPNNE